MSNVKDVEQLTKELEKEVIEVMDELGDVAAKGAELFTRIENASMTESDATEIVTNAIVKNVKIPTLVPNFMVKFAVGLVVKSLVARKKK